MATERPLNFRQLEAFRAVMLTGSMTGAGALMHISQPAVTRLIRDLETELRLALFNRQGPQLVPTPEGRRLYREVERHFSGAHRIRQAARAIRESSAGYLHVGVVPNLAGSCMPRAVRLFLERFPEVVVSVYPDSSPNLLEMMAHGQLDIAYAAVPADRRGLDHDRLAPTPAVCILPQGHRLAARKKVSVNDLDGEDFVSLGAQSVLRMQINAALLLAGVHPNVRLETLNSATAAAYVGEGIGLAVVDPFAARVPAARGVEIRPFTPRISLQLSAIYREAVGRTREALAFTDVLQDVITEDLGRTRAS